MIDNCWLSCRWCECRHFNLSSWVEMKSHFAELLGYNARPSNQNVGTSVRACLFNTVEVCANLYWLSYRLAETRGRSEERKKKRDNMPTVCQGRNVSRSEKMYLEQRLPRKESDVGARHTNRNATERSFIKTWRSDICTVYNALSGSHSCVLVNLHALIYGSGNVCIDLKENTAWKHDWI